MQINFFSFGGGQFWADVFFYQKWRIQRNCVSKSYRLLDPWDIVRYKGSFESCRKAFVEFVDIYELPRQKGSMIVMLHGFGQTKNVFKSLWRKALDRGFLAAAVNYPSMQMNSESHTRQLVFFLNNLEDVNEVCFVTYGSGSIVLRKLLNISAPWQKKLKIGRIVQIAPREKSSWWIDWLAKSRITKWICGPMLEELDDNGIDKIPEIPSNFECGKIYVNQNNKEEITNNKHIIEIKNGLGSPLKNRNIINATINFIYKGNF